ncbi:MAG: rRNA maturation RNase YbeY [Planctomycetota bacterium]|nr:rRNA maturation RNase YbeY [Planctomycetota bacterium]
MEIVWRTEDRPLGDEAVRAALEAAVAHGGRPGIELAVVFVDDETLARMHAEHLDDPAPTDVITFDLGEEGEGPAGELYVSVERAREVARRRGVTAERELALYLVHGALHLCGFDDRDGADRERMRRAESELLAQLGYPQDPRPHDVDP